MKNKTFIISAGACIFAVLLANLNLLIKPANIEWGTAAHTALTKLAFSAQYSLMPAVAVGLIVLLAVGRLRLWECSALCLSMAVLYALIYSFTNALFKASVSMAAMLAEITFKRIYFMFLLAGLHYLFPVFMLALAFYGFACKKRMIAVLCTVWSIINCFILNLLPPFFQKFSAATLSMDGGQAVRLQIYELLPALAAALLIFFIIADLRTRNNINRTEA